MMDSLMAVEGRPGADYCIMGKSGEMGFFQASPAFPSGVVPRLKEYLWSWQLASKVPRNRGPGSRFLKLCDLSSRFADVQSFGSGSTWCWIVCYSSDGFF